MHEELSSDTHLLGWFSISLGIVLGVLAGLVHVLDPVRAAGSFVTVLSVAVALVLVLGLAYRKLYRALPRGYGRMYLWGFGFSVVLYAVSLGLVNVGLPVLAILGLGFVVAAPLVLVGIRLVRR